eukprot:TRINITY_DN5888_c0_g1_i1.p1 TRINITY_DN5888_c0_g1~~TRINITY_DN5888_c0_g1_i1.p1  ORF type:complete len:664 (+),score=181.14 TRINITY_DN5888_c0_g1_i1:164-2155(+)
MASITEADFKEYITQILESKGVLGKIKANLRASVFNAVQEQQTKSGVHLEFTAVKKIQELSEGKMALALLCDFLEFYELENTLTTLRAESGMVDSMTEENHYQPLGKDYIANTFKLSRGNTKHPLLMELISSYQYASNGNPSPYASTLLDAAPRKTDDGGYSLRDSNGNSPRSPRILSPRGSILSPRGTPSPRSISGRSSLTQSPPDSNRLSSFPAFSSSKQSLAPERAKEESSDSLGSLRSNNFSNKQALLTPLERQGTLERPGSFQTPEVSRNPTTTQNTPVPEIKSLASNTRDQKDQREATPTPQSSNPLSSLRQPSSLFNTKPLPSAPSTDNKSPNTPLSTTAKDQKEPTTAPLSSNPLSSLRQPSSLFNTKPLTTDNKPTSSLLSNTTKETAIDTKSNTKNPIPSLQSTSKPASISSIHDLSDSDEEIEEELEELDDSIFSENDNEFTIDASKYSKPPVSTTIPTSVPKSFSITEKKQPDIGSDDSEQEAIPVKKPLEKLAPISSKPPASTTLAPLKGVSSLSSSNPLNALVKPSLNNSPSEDLESSSDESVDQSIDLDIQKLAVIEKKLGLGQFDAKQSTISTNSTLLSSKLLSSNSSVSVSKSYEQDFEDEIEEDIIVADDDDDYRKTDSEYTNDQSMSERDSEFLYDHEESAEEF